MATYSLDAGQCRNFEVSSKREWLLTNGIGGFAMGTVSGANTRRYHGHLVAATDPPAQRMVLVASVEADIQSDGNPIGVSCNQYVGAVHPEGYQYLEGFTVSSQVATWRYRVAGMVMEKHLALHPGQNACTLVYANAGPKPFHLALRPLILHRSYHDNFRAFEEYPSGLAFPRNKTVVEHAGVPIVIRHDKARRMPAIGWFYRFEHLRELERGLDGRDDLFCPCELGYELLPGETAVLVLSAFDGAKPHLQWPDEPPATTPGDCLRDAASKFFVETRSRHSILAGFPWFTDWGRDTMIALPGLCLHTGRVAEARAIILDYASQMKQGLIPNRFVEHGEPEYNTVDATLWFAQAIYRTLEAEWDEKFARKVMKPLESVFNNHVKGTLFGIKADPSDGLLHQGEEGVQLTWMDARVGDWVVTPRHGKPVEINGLWINALRVMEWLADRLGKDSTKYRAAAEKAEASFEAKFWKESLGFYLDTAEPDDASLRPNQLIAMALPFGPAKGKKAQRALDRIGRELVTPVGLRTLGPAEPAYIGKFEGPMAERDAAYHQGTVWPWLMGPYVTALVRLTGDRAEAKRLLKNARELIYECGIGGIAEVYDGDEPRQPGGCPWQAWSVAEWLRAWVEDAGGK